MNKRICEDCLYCYVDKNRRRKCRLYDASVIGKISQCPINISDKDIDILDNLDSFNIECILNIGHPNAKI